MKRITKKLPTGVTTTTSLGKSYIKDSEQIVERIEVHSQLYEFDTIYQDVTLDTKYQQWQENQLKNTFKNLGL